MANDVVMVFGGDVHVQRPDPGSMFAEVAPALRKADVLFGNLEGIISAPIPGYANARGAGHLRADPEMLAAYKSAGFSVLGLGNHGSTTCGVEGLLRCMELLDKEGIAHAGGGRNSAEARTPAILERNGARIAVLAYSCLSDARFHAAGSVPGVAAVRAHTSYEFSPASSPGFIPVIHTRTFPEDLAMVCEDVRAAKSRADIVVTTWHWGLGPRGNGPLAGRVTDYQTELAHAAIDHGCDVVIGHHPHVLGAVEVYKGRPVFYTLGNFAFDYLADPAHGNLTYHGVPWYRRQSFGLARCVVRDRTLQEVSLLPMRIPREDPRPRLVDTTRGWQSVELLQESSEDFGTQFQVRDADVLVLGTGGDNGR